MTSAAVVFERDWQCLRAEVTPHLGRACATILRRVGGPMSHAGRGRTDLSDLHRCFCLELDDQLVLVSTEGRGADDDASIARLRMRD